MGPISFIIPHGTRFHLIPVLPIINVITKLVGDGDGSMTFQGKMVTVTTLSYQFGYHEV
jgi:hypothetical protein